MATKRKERELTVTEHKVLACVVLGNASLDLFRHTSRDAIDVAIKTLRNRALIRMGARGYFLATPKGRRVRWAKVGADSETGA